MFVLSAALLLPNGWENAIIVNLGTPILKNIFNPIQKRSKKKVSGKKNLINGEVYQFQLRLFPALLGIDEIMPKGAIDHVKLQKKVSPNL